MISDFQQLTAKVSELAELAQSLRRENAELRRAAVAMSAENAELNRRMEEAHQRVAALLASIPAEVNAAAAHDEESA
nr:DUF904 domain-containing protein [Paucimonas lemoignei]